MDLHARKLVIILVIAAIVLACFTTICYFAIREMTYLLWRAFYATIFIIILTVVVIVKKGDVKKIDIWAAILVIAVLSLFLSMII